jgi:3-hydroxymyristoyl/3-hydroxydecanoyl-(acyl carrier protein) dehydratase
MIYSTTLRVPATHPALPGHFPGRPIAPGVVLLDAVLRSAEAWLGRALSVAVLVHAKFTAPLAPDEEARLQLTLSGAELRFTITRGEAPIAQGAFRLHQDAAA